MNQGPKYYEMHITLRPQYKEEAEQVAQKFNFKTSQIAGDQILGDDAFLYITGKDVSLVDMMIRMEKSTEELLGLDVPIIRRKIEHVIFDERRTP